MCILLFTPSSFSPSLIRLLNQCLTLILNHIEPQLLFIEDLQDFQSKDFQKELHFSFVPKTFCMSFLGNISKYPPKREA